MFFTCFEMLLMVFYSWFIKILFKHRFGRTATENNTLYQIRCRISTETTKETQIITSSCIFQFFDLESEAKAKR